MVTEARHPTSNKASKSARKSRRFIATPSVLRRPDSISVFFGWQSCCRFYSRAYVPANRAWSAPLWILRGWAPPNQTGTRLVNREFATRNAELARHPHPRFAIKHAYAHNAPNLARPVRFLRRLLQPVSRQHRPRSTPRRASSHRIPRPPRRLCTGTLPANRPRTGHALDAGHRHARTRLEWRRSVGPHRFAPPGLALPQLDSSPPWHPLVRRQNLRLDRAESLPLEPRALL